ncbi:MAG TPA: hypothetical protein VFP68_18470 [Burkholderiaceae bacterium]|nr:hypothetical protein [Burkholderiaceae bacterium]
MASRFSADPGNGSAIFDLRGIECERSAVVVVRLDQYSPHVLPLDAHGTLAAFFDGFMLRD